MSDWYPVLNADEIPSPCLLIYPERIENNLQLMIDIAGGAEKLRPHVKTHKLPQIIELKRACGIEKFKCSTIAEAEMTAAAGGKDILLAYQPVGPGIPRLLTLMLQFPQTKFSTIVDDAEIIRQIGQLATEKGLEVPLYLDLDVGMHRTGIVPGEAGRELYRLIAQTKGVSPAGLHAYDGHLHDPDEAILKEEALRTFQQVIDFKAQLEEEGYDVPGIAASGTPTFPILAQYPDVEVGCGTSVLWDAGQPRLSGDPGFQNAAVLLARVISKPHSDLLTLDLGHKAVASEMPHPRVRLFGLEDAEVVIHSEEHLTLKTPLTQSYRVGDVVYGLPWHVCPTVALHHEAWVVREQRAVECWEIVARRRRISI
ncbi:D-TA family PLP-dependent enzyme [Rubinisphaera sp.]|uniref:D-TA family PLP-dependent enzyme n=1 Tax=Rubinisphaera sp. TaxID=2024857 RepID=UPI000C102255|nr:D-TA family PLP-dependent enzyme [Rubinisphaera sp.]MBV07759.1 threonine aldolase [Rubinisphaera sp.]|tara:strand:- start:2107 stop:3213 length:1107 start_codon:yes stop_codon:yes gene_type:complete